MNKFRLSYIFFILITVLSCDKYSNSKQQTEHGLGGAVARPDIITYFNKRLSEHGSLTFVSRLGRRLNSDSDTTIELRTDGTIEIVEYGLGVDHYRGFYKFNGDLEIESIETGYPNEWPKMILKKDKDGVLVLYRSDGVTKKSSDSPAVPHFENFWPFRCCVSKLE